MCYSSNTVSTIFACKVAVIFWGGSFLFSVLVFIGISSHFSHLRNSYALVGFPGGSVVKNPPAKQETQVLSLG